jgi:hypothetical protein
MDVILPGRLLIASDTLTICEMERGKMVHQLIVYGLPIMSNKAEKNNAPYFTLTLYRSVTDLRKGDSADCRPACFLNRMRSGK